MCTTVYIILHVYITLRALKHQWKWIAEEDNIHVYNQHVQPYDERLQGDSRLEKWLASETVCSWDALNFTVRIIEMSQTINCVHAI